MNSETNTERKKYNVLVATSHPDDAELGCGATIAKHVERGDNVVVVVLTKGEKGNHDMTIGECRKSLKLLGVNEVVFGNFPDGFLKDNHEVVNFIETMIKRYNIDRIYTHDPHDRHQDHRHCGLAASAAARKIKEVFLFRGPSTTDKFEPHYFVEVTYPQLLKKLAALSCYNSQVKKGIVDLHLVESEAGFYGGRLGSKYAEAFALNHYVRGGWDV